MDYEEVCVIDHLITTSTVLGFLYACCCGLCVGMWVLLTHYLVIWYLLSLTWN